MGPWLIGDIEKFYDTTGDIKLRDEQRYGSDEGHKREKDVMPNACKPKKMEIVLEQIKNNHHWERAKDKNQRRN